MAPFIGNFTVLLNNLFHNILNWHPWDNITLLQFNSIQLYIANIFAIFLTLKIYQCIPTFFCRYYRKTSYTSHFTSKPICHSAPQTYTLTCSLVRKNWAKATPKLKCLNFFTIHTYTYIHTHTNKSKSNFYRITDRLNTPTAAIKIIAVIMFSEASLT